VFKLQVIVCIAVALAGTRSSAQQTYRRADVDTLGQRRIITVSGREIDPHKDSDQVAFDQVAISDDHRSVGWVGLYPNCCTSYPIPLKLVVLTDGTTRTFVGDGLPVWQWSFSADGKRIAFRQAPIHGDDHSHFELRDLRTGRLVGTFDADSADVRAAPMWVRALQPPAQTPPSRRNGTTSAER
jgi:hypothetical protein